MKVNNNSNNTVTDLVSSVDRGT